MPVQRLSHDPVWDVIDSTKISCYLECPRKFMFQHRAGWRSTMPSMPLVHGTAMHSAMEVLFKYGYQYRDAALKAYIKVYEKSYAREDWDELYPNPTIALALINEYVTEYADDNFICLDNEITGLVPVSDTRAVVAKLDSLLKTPDSILIVDHKTSGYALTDAYVHEKNMSIQFNTYYLLGISAVQALGEDINLLEGILINHLRHMKTRVEVSRFTIQKTLSQMESYLWELNKVFDRIEEDDQRLLNSTSEDRVLKCFPRNLNNCVQFFRKCPFYDFCKTGKNPLYYMPVQPGFEVSFWNPLTEDEDKVVVNTTEENIKEEKTHGRENEDSMFQL